jgi:hypothetical protein
LTYKPKEYEVPSAKPVAVKLVVSGPDCWVNGGTEPLAIVTPFLWAYHVVEKDVVFHIDADKLMEDVVVEETVMFPPKVTAGDQACTVIDPCPCENPLLFAKTVTENDASDVIPDMENTPDENVADPGLEIV